jgi:hypothetical protein
MNVSKFLITSASALAIVGTVGFAVAQTGNAQTGPTTTPSNDAITNPTMGATGNTQTSPMPAAPMQADTSVAPASPMVNAETSMTPERMPQADRN